MNLSLQLILWELEQSGVHIKARQYNGLAKQQHLSRALFYSDEKKLQSGILYLVPPETSLKGVAAEIGSAALYCELQDGDEHPCSMPNISYGIIAKQDILLISNLIGNIFDKYNKWQEQLTEALLNGDLQKMADVSHPIFQNSMHIINDTFQLLAATRDWLDYFSMPDVPGQTLPLHLIDYLKNDSFFNQASDFKEVFVFPADSVNVPSICINLFPYDEYFGRILLSETSQPIRPFDYDLLEFFSEYVNKYLLMSRVGISEDSSSDLMQLFIDMLSGKEVSQEILQKKFAQEGWQLNQHFLSGCLLPSRSDVKNKTISSYCRQFMKKYDGAYAFELNGSLALIVNLSAYNDSYAAFMSRFVISLRDGNFRGGFSSVFTDFTQMPHHYHQAEIALSKGLDQNPTIWYHTFSEYALSYILDEAALKMPRKLLCAHELLILIEYDRQNQSDYYHTLKVYLDNHMNASKTAKDLFIHQATMVYRLKRLKELMQIDFSDVDKILYLHLSIKLLEEDR